MLKSILLSALSLTVLAGCAADAASDALPPTHPANPTAAEARAYTPSGTLDVVHAPHSETSSPSAPAATAQSHDAHDGHAVHRGAEPDRPVPAPTIATAPAPAEAATYSCPHHPEVVSNEPGKCPKCKMTLTKTAGAEGRGHDH
jgi:hypothetical protein